MAAIESLERQLRVASTNNTALQRQQTQLMESVHTLLNMVASTTGTDTQVHMQYFSHSTFIFITTFWHFAVAVPPRSQTWRDCADAYKAGHYVSGLYHIYIGNRTQPVQVASQQQTYEVLQSVTQMAASQKTFLYIKMLIKPLTGVFLSNSFFVISFLPANNCP